MNKVLTKFFILFLCFACCNACSCKKEDFLITYRNFYNQDISTFNYLITNEYQDTIRIANLVDGLVENDKYGNIVPSIAKSWKREIVNNKEVYTFYLKDDVYWSDYANNKYALVTAHDFVNSAKYILNYNSKSSNYSLIASLIENGMNYYNATLIANFNYDEVSSKVSSLIKSDPNNELSYYTNIKNIFDSCNASSLCINDFNTVGIKAINDFELQYTLQQPTSYFLSALTYSSFLPSNEKFIKDIGFNNFGTNKKNLLYNGAYLLKDYFHSSRIEYIKNDNYWDKDNVFIDKLIFTKSLNYSSSSYVRIMYEAGNIDEFYLNKNDSVGLEKYVYGKNHEGSFSNPVGDNTYINNEAIDFTSYYIVFNQERTNTNYSVLTEEENLLANKALKNLNFRKALTHGLDRSSYLSNDLYNSLSSIVPKNFINELEYDYYTYYVNTYASKNNINYNEALELLNSDPFYDTNKSKYYLDLAINELNLSKNQLPIKLEYTYYYDNDYVNYDNERIRKWNNALNGCDIANSNCVYDKIEIVYNSSINSTNQFNLALNNREYHLTLLGLYPDFVDPTTYLIAFSSNGEMTKYINHYNASEIDNFISIINNSSSLNERFDLCSKLEYFVIFENNLVLPLLTNSYDNSIVISNLVPYTKMKANYGLSPFKFKHRKLTSSPLTQNDIKALKEEYEKGKKEQ